MKLPFVIAGSLLIAAAGVSSASATTSGTCFAITGVSKGDSLNLREEPRASSRIVASFSEGSDPIIAKAGPCTTWCRVSVHTGDGSLWGYMHSRYLRKRECP